MNLKRYTPIFLCLLIGCSKAEQDPQPTPVQSEANLTIIQYLRDNTMQHPLCARALVEYRSITHPYDLNELVPRIKGITPVQKKAYQMKHGISLLATGFEGIRKTKQESLEDKHEIREMAYSRHADAADDRRHWTQMLAQYPADAPVGPNPTSWLVDTEKESIPRQLSLYLDGREHYRHQESKKWHINANTNGWFLVSFFETHGSCLRNVQEGLFDPEQFEMTASTTGEVLRCVWTHRGRSFDQEVGIEMSLVHTGQVYKAWWGKGGFPRNVSLFSNFFQTASGHYYPKHTTRLTQLQLEDELKILKEEHYTVLGTQAVLGCDFDHSIFNSAEYIW